MPPAALQFHTYFFFPFQIEKQEVQSAHPDIWPKSGRWLSGLDDWITAHHHVRGSTLLEHLGGWQRDAYSRFDLESEAYEVMTFFHPYMRQVFFDVAESSAMAQERTALLRCYTIPLKDKGKLYYSVTELNGAGAKIEITDLRLFLFANGIGILSFGAEASDISVEKALFINESMRKVYPSSGMQIRENRAPQTVSLTLEHNDNEYLVIHHNLSESGGLQGVLPPLANTITSLLYFASYQEDEYEPLLDERMVVYSYLSIDPRSVPDDFIESEEYQILLSQFLYVDRVAANYRYEKNFVREAMRQQLYTRWAHQGTYYGFTSYSGVTLTFGEVCVEGGFRGRCARIHGMFKSRYYMMSMVALFYRVTLLGFVERLALTSKQLYLDQADGRFDVDNLRMADTLRGDFLHFSNHWYFSELANKDEEVEHFNLQREQYRLDPMLTDTSEELDALNAWLHSYYQFRNTEAVNRLAVLSLILGGGAVLTGYFGMNFELGFADLFFKPGPSRAWVQHVAIVIVSLLAFGALLAGTLVVVRNWRDYRETFGSTKKEDLRATRRALDPH